MSIGNKEFGLPRKYQYQIVFSIYVQNFLVFSWYFIGILSTALLKFGLIFVFFGRTKSVWYLVSVVVISLVSVWFRFIIP